MVKINRINYFYVFVRIVRFLVIIRELCLNDFILVLSFLTTNAILLKPMTAKLYETMSLFPRRYHWKFRTQSRLLDQLAYWRLNLNLSGHFQIKVANSKTLNLILLQCIRVNNKLFYQISFCIDKIHSSTSSSVAPEKQKTSPASPRQAKKKTPAPPPPVKECATPSNHPKNSIWEIILETI